MKKIFTLFVSLLIALSVVTGQEAPPQAFSFKALIKDSKGLPVILKTVSLRISILQDAPNGTVAYCETFRVQTNLYAQVDLEIGRGTVVTGIFSAIDWGADEYFIKIEVDVKGGTHYSLLSVAQMLSVPYALYAGNLSGAQDNDDDPQNELISNAYLSGTALTIVEDGLTTIVELSGLLNGVDVSTTNELQNLFINDHVLRIENGNEVTLPDEVDDADSDPVNEIQVLNLEGNILTLTTNGDPISIDLTPYLDNTDNQTLALEDHQLAISGGNTVLLPDNTDDADHDPLNEIQQLSISGDRISLSRDGGYVDIPLANNVNGLFVFGDRDNDSYGDPFKALWIPVNYTPPPGYVTVTADCNDDDPTVNPGEADLCDGKDNNCNGVVDEDCMSPECYNLLITYFNCLQTNGCQFDDPECIVLNCSEEFEAIGQSGADGECISGLMMNWNELPFDETWTIDAMANFLVTQCGSPDIDHDGYSVREGDCDDSNPAINPGAAEICGDGIDQNCNGIDPECGDGDEDGYTVAEGDCNDADPTIFPTAPDLCDQKDNDCDGETDEDAEWIVYYKDNDGDRYGDPNDAQAFCSAVLAGESGYVVNNLDCDDTDPRINPSYPEDEETCGDGIDQDCSGADLLCSDLEDDDQDGYSEVDGDCDDSNIEVNPGATEICGDGIDQNCDGIDPPVSHCSDDDGDGYTETGGDCNDSDPSVHPGAAEICDDGIDQNCDGAIDEGCCISTVAQLLSCMDDHGCSYSDPLCVLQHCSALYGQVEMCLDPQCVISLLNDPDLPFDETWDYTEKATYICSNCGGLDGDGDGLTENEGDCDDSDATVYPGATEICGDGIDQDCNGSDLDISYCTDNDGDGITELQGDCDDSDNTVYPGATEIRGDGIDQDCDGEDLPLEEDIDDDNDGYTENEGDCDDTRSDVYPGAQDYCDFLDNDCDGKTDEDSPPYLVFTDADGDGWGNDQTGHLVCDIGEGETDITGDCDDTNAGIFPGATEVCGDGIDQNCDGMDQLCPEDIDDDGDGYTENTGDCDDNSMFINPGAVDYCGDGIDQDCSGSDQLCPEDIDDDSDGFTEHEGDCNDGDATVYPGAVEICSDGIDQDCNGSDILCPEDVDDDRDGFTENQGDCNDEAYFIYPGADEICGDGIDQNCDGADLSCLDVDNDGDSFTENQGDCDDFDPDINPAMPEICGDGIDQDCDGDDPECVPTIKMIYPSSVTINQGGSATVYVELVSAAPVDGVEIYGTSSYSTCLSVTPVITISEGQSIGSATVTGLCAGFFSVTFALGVQQVSMTVTVQ